MTGFGPLGGVVGTGATTAAGVGAGVAAGGVVAGGFGAVVAGAVGGIALGGAGALGFVGYQTYAVSQLIQNRYIMKVISNARDGKEKALKDSQKA